MDRPSGQKVVAVPGSSRWPLNRGASPRGRGYKFLYMIKALVP